MTKLHKLKTDPEVFQSTRDGVKSFEVRLNDRDYGVGDKLTLQETVHSGEEMKGGAPLKYTGREIYLRVKHILHGPIYGLCDEFVIMSVNVRWYQD